MSQFECLSFNDDGYVIRCRECKYYHIAFCSTLLMISEEEFTVFCESVKQKCDEEDYQISEHAKSIIIKTPYECIHMLLSKNEAKRFSHILEEADNEIRAQSIMSLFRQ